MTFHYIFRGKKLNDIIARRQFDPLYIWLDIAFLVFLAGLLLASCASSERMTRMSGVLERYEKPRRERIDGFAARVPEEQLAPLDDSLINLWPFFYRNNLYTSVFWPMIDSDPYGFAVRPFYNQEGNEYSILFPPFLLSGFSIAFVRKGNKEQ